MVVALYTSPTKAPMATKLGRMMTYVGLLPIKSHDTEKERAEKENMQETPL